MNYETPQYIVKKSMWTICTLPLVMTTIISLLVMILGIRFISFWFIFVILIPAGAIFFEVMKVKNFRLEFYETKVVKKWGWISKHEDQNMLIAVPQVEVHQNLIGRIFNFGHVFVDLSGRWDKKLKYIKNPFGLKNYLQPRISKASKGVTRMMRD